MLRLVSLSDLEAPWCRDQEDSKSGTDCNNVRSSTAAPPGMFHIAPDIGSGSCVDVPPPSFAARFPKSPGAEKVPTAVAVATANASSSTEVGEQ